MSVPAAVLDLCGGTGAWSRPFADAGHPTHVIDIRHGHDVRTYEPPPTPVWGILAAPPCTVFARGGAVRWSQRTPQEIDTAIDIVRACLRIINAAKPTWWALENPPGRLASLVPELGPPAWKFYPFEYMDFYSKLTYVWTNVPKPPPTVPDLHFAATISPSIHKLVGHHDRSARRAITPSGFAEAFYKQVCLSHPGHAGLSATPAPVRATLSNVFKSMSVSAANA